MPVVREEGYRYRKVYTPHTVSEPFFYNIREADEELMRRDLPENCNGLSFYFSYYDSATGNTTYEYFENEGDMMRNMAVVRGDKNIYIHWIKREAEKRILYENLKKQEG